MLKSAEQRCAAIGEPPRGYARLDDEAQLLLPLIHSEQNTGYATTLRSHRRDVEPKTLPNYGSREVIASKEKNLFLVLLDDSTQTSSGCTDPNLLGSTIHREYACSGLQFLRVQLPFLPC